MKILVVDDDEEVRKWLTRLLVKHDIECVTAADADSARKLIVQGGPGFFDTILLDVNLPDSSGLSLLRKMREAQDETPVLLVTGDGKLDDRIHGLRLGADDYISKPFSGKELMARIEAVERRRRSLPIMRLGVLGMDLGRRQVLHGQERIDFSAREFDVLRMLFESRGRPVSKQELLNEVWGIDFDPGTTVVEVQIARIRRKLEPFKNPSIDTIVGKGYRLKLSDGTDDPGDTDGPEADPKLGLPSSMQELGDQPPLPDESKASDSDLGPSPSSSEGEPRPYNPFH